MILQANPSKKYGNRFSYHSTRKMQSLCCPIQLVVTTLAPKNKLWKRRERRNHLSWLTWVLFLAWNRNYSQQTPTLWQPRPQQPAKQSKVTQIEVSSKFEKEKIVEHPLAQMKFCSCPSPNNQVFVSPQNSGHTRCEAKSNKTDFPPATEVFCDCFCWVWRQTLSCVCSAPPPCHLHCQTQSLLTDVGQPPLPGILSQTERSETLGAANLPFYVSALLVFPSFKSAFYSPNLCALAELLHSAKHPKPPLLPCDLQPNDTYANEISAGKNNYSCSWED